MGLAAQILEPARTPGKVSDDTIREKLTELDGLIKCAKSRGECSVRYTPWHGWRRLELMGQLRPWTADEMRRLAAVINADRETLGYTAAVICPRGSSETIQVRWPEPVPASGVRS